MKTLIFKSEEDYYNREDKLVNGVSEAFAKIHPNFKEQNTTNEGCWNCYKCEDCHYCYHCNNCYNSCSCNNCDCCSSCNNCDCCLDCNYCDYCIYCDYCDYCNNRNKEEHLAGVKD